MADIFISYSRQDTAQADLLAELLASAGVSVWIDRAGIEAATSWSREIVQAIDACRVFVVLLSANSVQSENVAKEVSIAAEQRKKILPIDMEPVELTLDLRYHLAGLQRTSITNVDGVVRALSKLGLEAPQAAMIKPVKEADSRKSLMILPFEDLSPGGDNAWFSDGLTSELISTLSKVKSLRVADPLATRDFKRYSGPLQGFAHEARIRYFVQGDVRKFGDQLKITSRLLDSENGDVIWQDALKGTMNDIFDMQEEVAKKVLEGLQIHLVESESRKLSERGTANPEAYELYLKAEEYFSWGTKDGYQFALKAIGTALEIDPDFALAKLRRAIILVGMATDFGPHPEALAEAVGLLEAARRTISAVDDWRVLGCEARLAFARGEFGRSEELRRKNIELAPTDTRRLDDLASHFLQLRRLEESIPALEESMKVKPDHHSGARRLIAVSFALGRRDLKEKYSRLYLDLFAQRLRMAPGDEDARVVYGLALAYSGRTDEALEHLRSISDSQLTSVLGYRNGAALAALLGEYELAMHWLTLMSRFDFEEEFENWVRDVELEPLREREDFQKIVEIIDAKAAAAASK